ncbi:hypothetical protein DIRU0_C17766 [Diutina rugosa]
MATTQACLPRVSIGGGMGGLRGRRSTRRPGVTQRTPTPASVGGRASKGALRWKGERLSAVSARWCDTEGDTFY